MTRKPWPFPTAASHPKADPAQRHPFAPAPPSVEVQEVSEPALDHAGEESFPASDPVSVVATKVVADKADNAAGDDRTKAQTTAAQAAVQRGKPSA